MKFIVLGFADLLVDLACLAEVLNQPLGVSSLTGSLGSPVRPSVIGVSLTVSSPVLLMVIQNEGTTCLLEQPPPLHDLITPKDGPNNFSRLLLDHIGQMSSLGSINCLNAFSHIPDPMSVVNDCFHPLINSVRTWCYWWVTKHVVGWISPGGIFMVQQHLALVVCSLSLQRCCRHIERRPLLPSHHWS